MSSGGGKGDPGLLAGNVMEILDTEQESTPMPSVIIGPGLQYYRGILRYKEN